MKEKKLDLYAALVIFAVGAFIFVNSFSISTLTNMTIGPDFMPKVTGGGLMALSLVLGVYALRAMRAGGAPEEQGKGGPVISGRFLATTAVIFGYFFLLKPLGYLISTALYAFCHFMLLTAREEWKSKLVFCLILAVAVSAGTYYSFRSGFNLMLPEGILR